MELGAFELGFYYYVAARARQWQVLFCGGQRKIYAGRRGAFQGAFVRAPPLLWRA